MRLRCRSWRDPRDHRRQDRFAGLRKYKGSDGRLRTSARHIDPILSTEDVPAHSFDRVDKISPGQVVDIEIDLLPIGLRFNPGEQLRFAISVRNLLGTMMAGIGEYVGANTGRHVIHTGGSTPSYLRLPVRKR
ncbi:CocE/NonD family hydrolase C-terminal non-catalytic domain-containing protein [Catellatospora methionotrophica]|uniref:CocE/NonD family hydrolase C-terminal non-catalytic domain-containing protein n=1 Tax=Catellatospora methionotrophica TaxID=121620 RepID=UPI0019407FC9|nr:CocE/NonD family hydrolase C-terminal non-catalytic domain-containing protein [Catellatospora methionotrophica]